MICNNEYRYFKKLVAFSSTGFLNGTNYYKF